MSIFGTQLSSAHNFLFLEKRLVCGIAAPRANSSNESLETAWNLKLITAIKEIKNDSSNETEQLRKAVEGSIKLNRANDKIVDTMNEGEAKNILQAVLDMNVLGEGFDGIPAKYKRVCVLALQTRLASLGYMPARAVDLDGIYGKRTRAAVAQFQKEGVLMKKGTSPDGKAGKITVTALISDAAKAIDDTDAVVNEARFSDTGNTVKAKATSASKTKETVAKVTKSKPKVGSALETKKVVVKKENTATNKGSKETKEAVAKVKKAKDALNKELGVTLNFDENNKAKLVGTYSVVVTDTGEYRLTGGSRDSEEFRDLEAFIKFAKEQIGTVPVTGLRIEDSVTTVENGESFTLIFKGLFGEYMDAIVVNKTGEELQEIEIDGAHVKFQVNDSYVNDSDVSFQMQSTLDYTSVDSKSMGNYSAAFNEDYEIVIGRPKIKN